MVVVLVEVVVEAVERKRSVRLRVMYPKRHQMALYLYRYCSCFRNKQNSGLILWIHPQVL